VSVAAAGIAVIGVSTTPQVSSAATPTCSYANNPMLVLQLNNSTATVIGSSTVPGFVGDIPLQNVNFGSSQQYSFTGTGGTGAGKLSFAPFTFTKPVDPTSPLLFANEANGTAYGFATIYSGPLYRYPDSHGTHLRQTRFRGDQVDLDDTGPGYRDHHSRVRRLSVDDTDAERHGRVQYTCFHWVGRNQERGVERDDRSLSPPHRRECQTPGKPSSGVAYATP
jgi:hypothetical protein